MSDQFSRGVTVGVEQRGNVFLGLGAGLIAAILGAVLWALVQVGLNLQIGLVALGIGAMVGFAVRVAGHGSHVLFGVMGAVLTLVGCVGGDILSQLYVASSPQQGMLALAGSTDYVQVIQTLFTKMDVISYVIYAIGIYEGYKLSIVK